MDKNADIDAAIGQSIQKHRLDRGLTAAQLAEAAGISPAMVSRLENGHVSPSLTTLQALADAFEVPLMALFAFSQQASDVHHVPAGQGLASRRVTDSHAHDYLLLGKHSDPSGLFQAARIRISREDAGTLPRYQHEGQVFIYVVSGQARYACAEETFVLTEGDTLSFDARLPHGFTEIETEALEFLTVSTRRD